MKNWMVRHGIAICGAGSVSATSAGGSGDDRYDFNLGDGSDTIIDLQGANTLVFGAGLTRAGMSVTQGLVGLRAGGDAVHVENSDYVNPLANTLQQRQLASWCWRHAVESDRIMNDSNWRMAA